MRQKKLSELLDISIGRTPSRNEPSYWGKGHRWVSIRDLSSKIVTETKEQITDLAVKDARCKIVKKGTLLFSFKLTIGKMAFAGCDLFTNEAIAAFAIKDKKELNPEFLYYALHSATYGGSNQAVMGKTLNSKSLAEIEVPVPPLDDQIRIAHLLGKVEGLIAQRKQHLKQLDDLLKSVFLEMFGDPVKNDRQWKTQPFSQIGRFISGGTPSKSRDDYWAGEYPWVSPKDMKTPRIFDSEDHISDKAFGETSLKRIAPGHLLIVVRGMILAHSFPVAINMVDVAINQDMKAIKVDDCLRVDYVYHCLSALKRQILKLITTAGHGTKKLDSDVMEKLLVPVPPPEIQGDFISIADKVEVLKSRYQQSLTDLEALYSALSQQSFKGELDLSRVLMPGIEPIQKKNVEAEPVQAPTEQGQAIHWPDSDNLLDVLESVEARKNLLAQWLEAYRGQLGSTPFSVQDFVEAVENRLAELQPDNDFALSSNDYEHIKAWIFEALTAGRLAQAFDDAGNRIQLKAVQT